MVKEHFNERTLCLLEPVIIGFLKKIFSEFSPEIIVEFGTYCGGFTKYLAEWCTNASIYSFDILNMVSVKDREYLNEKGNITLITADIFNSKLLLEYLLSLNRRKILFCDGGNKKKEINTFAKYLKSGDILGTHDFGSEVTYNDIENTLLDFNEHPINDLFSNVGYSEVRLFTKKE